MFKARGVEVEREILAEPAITRENRDSATFQDFKAVGWARRIYGTQLYRNINGVLRNAEGSWGAAVTAWKNAPREERAEWYGTLLRDHGGGLNSFTTDPEGKFFERDPAKRTPPERYVSRKDPGKMPSPLDVIAEMWQNTRAVSVPTKLYRVFGRDSVVDWKKDDQFVDYGFMSAEHSPNYYKGNGGFFSQNRNVRMQLYVPPGARMNVGNLQENEIIISPGSRWQVLSTRQSTNAKFESEIVLGMLGYENVDDIPKEFGIARRAAPEGIRRIHSDPLPGHAGRQTDPNYVFRKEYSAAQDLEEFSLGVEWAKAHWNKRY
jgi:hypothetical protein